MIGDITERERERKKNLINPYNSFYKRNFLQKVLSVKKFKDLL